MATPNYGAEANTPVAKTWSYTRTKIIKLSHTWTIENFSFWQGEEILRSSKFSAEGYDGLEWYLTLLPQGSHENSRNYISSYLILDSRAEVEVQAMFKLSILDTRQEEMAARCEKKPHRFVPGGSWGYSKIVKRDDLLNCLRELSSDEIAVCCEASVAVETVNVPSQKFPIQTGVLK